MPGMKLIRAALLVGCLPFTVLAGGTREISPQQAVDMVRDNFGSVVIFHAYASWCTPCARELPEVIRLSETYRTEGLVVIAVSLDRDPGALTRFLGHYRLPFASLRIDQRVHNDFSDAVAAMGGKYQNAIPYTAVFDRLGRLQTEWTGSRNFQTYSSIVTPLLAERAPATPRTAESASPDFTLDEHPLLKCAKRSPRVSVYTANGLIPPGPTDDPVFIAGAEQGSGQVRDRGGFSEERLRHTGALEVLGIRERKEITVNNIPGYELVAEARDTDINKTLLVYQAVLFDGTTCFVMQGFVRPAEEKTILPAFRTLASSLRKK